MEPATQIELQLLEKFRCQISDLQLHPEKFSSDFYLLRWIRAREHRLKDAEDMLRKHMEWRKENKINEIMNWNPPPNLPPLYPFDILCFDKIGCPVILIPFGQWNIRKAVDSGMKPDLVRYVDKLFHMTESIMDEKSVTQIDIIIDFKDFSFWQLASVSAVETILERVKRFEANHPEILRHAFCINSSNIFLTLWKLVKQFLSARTMAKVHIMGSSEWEWRSLLLKYIADDQLPIQFGGKAKDRKNTFYFQNTPTF